jgi:monofunctional biosynthetic peptidoglycan transglycosylase
MNFFSKTWMVRIALALGLGFLLLGAWVFWAAHGLPGPTEIRGQLWSRFRFGERATWLPLWSISPRLQTAVVAWEDPRFYFHHGFDYPEIARALRKDLLAGAYRTSGSTITQQVAKNLFLSPEKSLRRKLREAILTRRLEGALSKDDILEIYLNIADWGDGIAGAEAASRAYFSKSAAELSWAEAALLASILANPHRFNPLRTPEEVNRRRQAVLVDLALDQRISAQELREALAVPCCARSK